MKGCGKLSVFGRTTDTGRFNSSKYSFFSEWTIFEYLFIYIKSTDQSPLTKKEKHYI